MKLLCSIAKVRFGASATRSRANCIVACIAAGILATIAGCEAIDWPWGGHSRDDVLLLAGTVDAHEVDLSFQVSGRIQRLDTDEGKAVAEGEVLAELDPRDLELALARARAQADSADKALALLKAGSRTQDIRAAEAAVRQAEADLSLARVQQQRMTQLVAEHFAPPQQLDSANDQLEVATAKLDQARQSLSLLREGPRREDIARAGADLQAAKVAVETAEQQLSYTRLVSPCSGVVSVRVAERGQNVTAGQAVLRVAELDRPWVRVYLSESDLARVRLGQAAQISIDGLPGRVFAGRLSFVSPEAEFTPKTVETRALRVDLVYRAKVDVDDAQGRLKIGMPADVRIAIAR
ncbi:MAG TPA: efflux RND transporter periplasmic adaptor subunit [Casimicrobiaceae bacterium]|nr:efflux RND transporter periplasmic adaptor subunit [Casimicrobiaceae bacterium]